MVPAPNGLEMTLALDDERTAVRADIGETAQLRVFVGYENQRLVEASIEQSERKNVTGRFHACGVACPLPAPGKYRVFLELEVCRVGIHGRRQSRCLPNVRVDLHRRRFAAARPDVDDGLFPA